ncbi:MAG: hypothetical protein QOK47_1562 [Actinomycetota bacterium]|jgi:FKBP-type peptidyl-prolyl cis-trans isomerase|nr:hypothetical protein [Actinomycetota bacterium]
MFRLALIACLLLTGVACSNESDCSTDPVTTDSGLVIKDVKCGEGAEAARGDSVSVHYTGTLENGDEFDSSEGGEPFSVKIGSGQVIEGWEEGLVGMREGGTRELTVPPDLGYGPDGYPPVIPPDATLTFEIRMISID